MGHAHRIRSITTALFSAVALLVAVPGAAEAAILPADVWVTDGEVNAVAVGNGRVFIGGDFSQVGPRTGGGVLIDAASGLRELPFDRIDGDVKAVVPDGSGGWYIGGDFIYVDDKWRPRVAHIGSDGAVTSWQPLVTGGSVESLVRDGSTLYVGGSFTTVAGALRSGLAALDVSSEAVSLLPWDPGTDGAVLAMARNHAGTGILVGGEFATIAGVARSRLAEVTIATGTATTFAPAADAAVRTIVASGNGSTVYVGGDFTTIAATGRSRLAAVTSAGALLAWNPGTDGPVHEIVEASDLASVYVGGAFGTVGGAGRDNVAEVTTGGNATGFDPDPDDVVYGLALAAGDSELLIAGAFTQVAGSTRNRLAEIRTSDASATSWDPNANGEAWTVAVGSGTVFAGGAFGSINGVSRANLAALDAASGALDTNWRADTDDEVLSLAVSFNGFRVFVGGRFSTLGGFSRNRLGAVKAKTGEIISTWRPQASGNVFAIHATQEHVYVGGEFTSIASTRRARVASLDPVFGALDLGFRADVDGRVRAITTSPDGDVVYVGGDFATVDGVPRANLAALEAATGNLIFSFGGVTGRKVYDLTTDQDRLYAAMGGAGGRFSAMDLDTGTEDYSLSADGDVQAVTLVGDHAYVGGHFDEIDGQLRTRLFAVDRVSGALSNEWTPSADGELSIFAMSHFSGAIWLGGDFHLVRSRTSQHVAKIGAIVEDDGLYASTVILDGADAYWRLGEAVGSDAVEEIDNVDGTYTGTPKKGVTGLVTGPDTAVRLSGDDAVELPDDAAVNTGGPYTDRTIELWFRADATSARQVLVETGGEARGYVVYVESGSVHAGVWSGCAGAVWTSTAITAGATHHVAFVHGSNGPGTVRLYVDGSERDSTNGAGSIASHSRDSAIGAMVDGSCFETGAEAGEGREFRGTIDEVALYDVQLSAQQIADHHAVGTTALDAGRVALDHEETRLVDEPLSYWRMGDDGVVIDAVGERHGQADGGVRVVRGRVGRGGASAFDGRDDVVLLPDDERANTAARTVARTIEAAFISRGSGPGVLYEEGGVTRGLTLYTNSGYVHAGAWDTSRQAIGAGTAFVAFASARIPRGVLTHVAMVFDATSGRLLLYVDGEVADEVVGVSSIGRHGNDRAVGAAVEGTRTKRHARYGSGLHFKGVIDEIVVYGTALGADTVREHATSVRS